MEFHEPSKLEQFLTVFLQGVFARPWMNNFVDRLHLTGFERVIDFGAGAGFIAKKIAAQLVRGGDLLCIDISKRWTKTARRRLRSYNNVDFLRGDVTELPISKNEFDLIVIHFALHDIPREQRKERLRVLVEGLREGGRLVIEEPTKESHGIPLAEVQSMCKDLGLIETVSSLDKAPLSGETFFADFKKDYETTADE
jgi:ubiquinone/menaquinone biosynthesis C-methylase UbiE